MLKFEMRQSEEKTEVAFIGDIDFDSAGLIEEEVMPQVLGKRHIELDFSHVDFVDSSGIGVLITLVGRIREQGNRINITRLNSDVKQVFSLLQLPEILGGDVFSDFH